MLRQLVACLVYSPLYLSSIELEKHNETYHNVIFCFYPVYSLVAANGCGKHGEDVTMSCAVDQIWNPETQQCMDTNA